MAKFQSFPSSKDVRVAVCNVTRSMTTATAVQWLPRGAQIIGFILSGTASNAGTTATLSLGSTSANSNEYVNAANVLAAGVGNGVNLLNGVAAGVGTVNTNPGQDANAEKRLVYAKYAETGVASSTGSWVLFILYTAGNYDFNPLV